MTTRQFQFKNAAGQIVPLIDPDPDMSPEQVRALYASQHPELLNAATVAYDDKDGKPVREFLTPQGRVKSDVGKIEFQPSIGRKG